jgi:hypothetical protein
MTTITAGQQRKLQRRLHLLAGATLLAYVYVPAAHELDDLVRFVVLPILGLTGIAMWQTARLRRAIRTARQGRGRSRLRPEDKDPTGRGRPRRS